MAYRPMNPGWGAAATAAKPPKKKTVKPPRPPAVGSPAWLASASSGDIAAYIAAQQPDYSGVDTTVDFDALSKMAQERADTLFADARKPYDEIVAQNADRLKASQEAATNFTTALAGILQGGQTGEAGMQFAKENYGGSYLGAVAGQMGADLMRQLSHDFGARETQLAEKIADLMSQKPEVYQSIMDDLLAGEEQRIKSGVELADSTFEHRVKALGAMLAQRRHEEELDQRETASKRAAATKIIQETIKAAKRNGVNLQVKKIGGRTYLFNPQTGALTDTGVVEPAKPGPQPARIKVNGVTYLVDPRTGERLGVVDVPAETPKPTSTSSKGVSPSTKSTTIARATDAGEKALERVTDSIWAKMPGSGAEQGTDEYARAEAAYNAWLDGGKSFGTAMAKVIAAISPHLKAIGYSRKQIRIAAYQIVSQELNPPKSYKAPR